VFRSLTDTWYRIGMSNHNNRLNPKRHLDPLDLEAEKEGAAIRRHNAIRPTVKRKPKRGSCHQTRHAA
tara:strand:+ start:178831 stop:179034 length:204 start_codon:yes stop_codon:yes gene_type:complete